MLDSRHSTSTPSTPPRVKIKSLLTPGLRLLLLVSMALAAFMFANTCYLLANRLARHMGWTLFATGPTSLPKVFQVTVLSHTGIGLVLVVLMLVFAIAHLPKVWKRRRTGTLASGIMFVFAGLVLAISGLFIFTAAAAGQRPWAWYAHVICAATAPLAYIVHRTTSWVKLSPAHVARFSLATASLLIVLLAAHAGTNRGVARTPEAEKAIAEGKNKGPGARDRKVDAYVLDTHVSDSDVPTASPFFPSAATTTTGDYLPSRIITRGDIGAPDKFRPDLDKYGFVVNERIGAETCARCHQDVVDQWADSAHRFASFNNPFYEATIMDMRENANEPNAFLAAHQEKFQGASESVGMLKSKWCSGCHDPSLMLAGAMERQVDRASPQAQAGLTCLACHAIDKIHNNTGNGNYNIDDEQEDPYILATSRSELGKQIHDAAIRAKPEVHKSQMLKPFFRSSEFCATCHKVSLQPTFNNYRWLRGQNEYDNWHDSGVSQNASRTFYLPPVAKVCQDCHMPPEPAVKGDFAAKNGVVKSHRFIAANTALPFLRGDQETIRRIEKFLQDEKLRVDIFALKTQRFEEPVLAVNHSKPLLLPGDEVEFTVVVRNKGVGHTFPGGTNDSNEGWLEVSVLDDNGEALAASGVVGPDGYVDPAAHKYHIVLLDKNGDPIHKRNAQDIHVLVYGRVIGPGTADGVHYRFTVPPELAGKKIRLKARLRWRKFDRDYTEFAFKANPEGFKQFKEVPDLPITDIAGDEVELVVGSGGQPPLPETVAQPDEWIRFNDYGISQFLQGNTRLAALAFDQVRRLQPQKPDGSRNLARIAIQDGNIARAYEHLRDCESLAPADPQTAWVWGVAFQGDGRYEEAEAADRGVLKSFPGDRAAYRNLGRTLYLAGAYEKALEMLDSALSIDREDRIAQQHRMFCLRALGREKEAAEAEAAFERYSIDESAQEITQQYRLRDPNANRETQMIHVHDLKIGNTAVVQAAEHGGH